MPNRLSPPRGKWSTSDAAIACAAVEAIGQLASPHSSPQVASACEDALFAALDCADQEVVKLALSVVSAQPGPRPMARLGLCLDHASWEVRRLAAELLAKDKGAAAQALLRARYEREMDPIVRDAIATAVSVRPPAGEEGIRSATMRTGGGRRPDASAPPPRGRPSREGE